MQSPSPLKICLLSYRSNPHCGGQGVYLKNISRALKDLGHSVDVVSGPPDPLPADPAVSPAQQALGVRAAGVAGTDCRIQPGPGGGAALDAALVPFEERAYDLVELSDALGQLAELDPILTEIVELRFFGGLTIEETAEALKVSPATVKGDWQIARSWLIRELG